jgi:hypothetical protein
MIQAYGTDTPTPADNAMQCFRPGWNGDSNASRECNLELQAWMERKFYPSRQNNASKLDGMHYNAISRQSNASGLDGMQAPAASADRAIRPGLNADSNAISRQSNVSGLDGMETPTQQTKKCFCSGLNGTMIPTKQTKKYFRPGWNEDFNNSRQSIASGLDGTKTSTMADKAMLQAWMERRLQQ